MYKTLATTVLLTASSFSVNANECGVVTIADMNWNSASLIAHVDAFILENGFDCEVDLVSGDTMPTGTSMIEKGQPDIAPEFWSNSFQESLDKGVADGRIRFAGVALSDGGQQGFWVPEYMVKKDPSLATISGIKANASLFKHPEDPDKSAIMGCPSGWNCQLSAEHLFTAMELDKSGFELIDPGSGAGLAASIAKAYERNQAWFGYYWAPTPVLGKYKMVQVDLEAEADDEYFFECIANPDCFDPKVVKYPTADVHSIVTEDFATKSVKGLEYITARSFTNAQMNILLSWMEDQQADGEYASEYFLNNYESIWSEWVTPDVQIKIKQALADL
ncbi:MAG: ABC transporter substrate-binding protein [Moritella sp.]|uniref:ABC transporter substrate-binding protein n=1 Tax=Moritella sp. TaxID=78556 RepID=UPI0029A609DB|nr:ABC transporter substrate-binding protein [Moritella sp.]MDX2319451.1 ABC transporter substrate-binding protein [Moritella sp.]